MDTLHEHQHTFLMISRSVLLRIRNVSHKSSRENKNTHFMFNNFSIYNRAVYEIMWKKHATDDNMAHAHCMLDNWSYRHTLRICNTYYFSAATIVALAPLSVTLYIHCLSCSYYYQHFLLHMIRRKTHTYSLFCVLNFVMPACRSNFTTVARTR